VYWVLRNEDEIEYEARVLTEHLNVLYSFPVSDVL